MELNCASVIANSPRKYGIGEARLIAAIVNGSGCFPDDSPPLDVRDDGVFVSEATKEAVWCLRGAKGIDEAFYWNPAWELEDGPSPLTAPLLPIPFTPRDLAAFLVGDISQFIRERFGQIGHLDETRLSRFGARDAAHARRALREAYELAAHALAVVERAERFEELTDDADQRLAYWRRAMVRELLEGSEVGRSAELVALQGQHQELRRGKDADPTDAQPRGSRQRQQEQDILQALRALGYDPESLPRLPAGTPGPKAEVRERLPAMTASVFKKAWDRLRGFGDIQDAD